LGDFPLLDKSLENSTYKTFNRYKQVWSPSQRNAFLRVKSGIVRHQGKILRFLTLTSAPEMLRSLQKTFDCMKTAIKRYTPHRLYKEGYISKNKIKFYYPGKNPFDTLDFEYIKIKTTEGNGVYHIPYFGDFLPYNFLCDLYSYYTGFAWDLDIRRVGKTPRSNKDRKKLSYYVMNQYVVNQQDEQGISQYNGYSTSWNWIFRGFTKWYNQFRSDYQHLDYLDRDKLVNKFLLRKGWIPPPDQMLLDRWDTDQSMIKTKNDWNGDTKRIACFVDPN